VDKEKSRAQQEKKTLCASVVKNICRICLHLRIRKQLSAPLRLRGENEKGTTTARTLY
jgi:hypothetical protein